MEFQKFNKIPRLSRDITITEKIDGTNFQIFICNYDFFTDEMTAWRKSFCVYDKDGLYLFTGSRNRWITPESDNNGSSRWAKENAEELLKLGEGRHYGEFYGSKIQRKYDLNEKRFSLFNVSKWHQKGCEKRLISVDPKTKEERYTQEAPDCCEVVPILYEGKFDTDEIESVLHKLKTEGSKAVPGFMYPEGIVIYHKASGQLFKKTIEKDEQPKGV